MFLLSLAKPFARGLSYSVTAVCKHWHLQPEEVTASIVLWISWASSTWLAFALSLLFIEIGETGEVSWLQAMLGGSLINVGQWLALRSHLRRPSRWIVTTNLAWLLLCLVHLGAVGWVVPNTPNLLLRGIFGVLYGSYAGLGVGLSQWWSLKGQLRAAAWRWIPLSAGLWAVSIAFAWMLGGWLRAASGLFLGEAIGLMMGWGAIAALSGFGIVALLYGYPPIFQRAGDSSKRAFAADKSNASGSKSPYRSSNST